MLEYKRIHVLKGIGVNKSNDKLEECDICNYWYFLNKNFNYEPYLCMQKTVSFNNVAVVSAKESDYRIHFCFMSKDDAINLLNNSVLSDFNGFWCK